MINTNGSALPPVLAIVGVTNAGKDSSTDWLCSYYCIEKISTGDVCRGINEPKTDIDRAMRDACTKAERDMIKAALTGCGHAPEELVTRLAELRFGFLPKWDGDTDRPYAVYTGFPRFLSQGRAMRRWCNVTIVELAIPENKAPEIVHQRIAGRLVCERCSAPYHVQFSPPTIEGICDKEGCFGTVSPRKFDNPEKVDRLIREYYQARPDLEEYFSSIERWHKVPVGASSSPGGTRSKVLELCRTVIFPEDPIINMGMSLPPPVLHSSLLQPHGVS